MLQGGLTDSVYVSAVVVDPNEREKNLLSPMRSTTVFSQIQLNE